MPNNSYNLLEELQNQNVTFQQMTNKQKITYLWDYYKIHALVFVVVIISIIYLLHAIITNRDYGYYCVLVNTAGDVYAEDVRTKWCKEIELLSDMNTQKDQVVIQVDLPYTDYPKNQFETGAVAKLSALSSSQTLDSIVADDKAFLSLVQNGYISDLTNILPFMQIDENSYTLFYCPAAVLEYALNDNEITDESLLKYDPFQPEQMIKPIPVGIVLSQSNRILTESDYYYQLEASNLGDNQSTVTVWGFAAGSKHLDIAIQAFQYFENIK